MVKLFRPVLVLLGVALLVAPIACGNSKVADEEGTACRSITAVAARTKCHANVCLKYGKVAEYSCGAFSGHCSSFKENLAECKAGCKSLMAAHKDELRGGTIDNLCSEAKFKP